MKTAQFGFIAFLIFGLLAGAAIYKGISEPEIEQDIITWKYVDGDLRPNVTHTGVTINGCHYIESSDNKNLYSLTHKGNCTNHVQ